MPSPPSPPLTKISTRSTNMPHHLAMNRPTASTGYYTRSPLQPKNQNRRGVQSVAKRRLPLMDRSRELMMSERRPSRCRWLGVIVELGKTELDILLFDQFGLIDPGDVVLIV